MRELLDWNDDDSCGIREERERKGERERGSDLPSFLHGWTLWWLSVDVFLLFFLFA